MEEQEEKVSNVFRELAGVLEAFEGAKTDFDVTHATPVSDNLLDSDSISVKVGTRIAFLERGLENADDTGTEITFTPTNAYLDDDGSLHVELQATANCGSKPVVDEEVSAPESDRGTESDPVSEVERSSEERTGGDACPKPMATRETDTADNKQTTGKNPKPLIGGSDGNGDDSKTTDATVDDQEQADKDAELPPYRDPARLREVYDEYDTFDEMTDALGADVTSQTVRRYMIKHDIHTPASETGSHSAEILLNMDPDDVSLVREESDSKDRNEIHPTGSPTRSFEKQA